MLWGTGVAFVQAMACLLGAKPLPEPMLTYCQLNPSEKTSGKFESKYKTFHSWKRIWKYQWNGGHFVQRWVTSSITDSSPRTSVRTWRRTLRTPRSITWCSCPPGWPCTTKSYISTNDTWWSCLPSALTFGTSPRETAGQGVVFVRKTITHLVVQHGIFKTIGSLMIYLLWSLQGRAMQLIGLKMGCNLKLIILKLIKIHV